MVRPARLRRGLRAPPVRTSRTGRTSGGDFAHRPRPAALGRVRKAGEAARTSGEDFTPWPRPAALGWVRKAGEAARTSGEDVAPWPRPAALGWVRKAGEAARVFTMVLFGFLAVLRACGGISDSARAAVFLQILYHRKGGRSRAYLRFFLPGGGKSWTQIS